MTLDELHKDIGIAYELGSGLALILTGLAALFPKIPIFTQASKFVGAAVADFSKLRT